MNEHRKTPIGSIIGHIMASLSQALFVSGTLAMLLHPLYHGHLVRPGEGDSFWVEYFTLGSLRVDHRLMFAGFVVAFVICPIVLGIWLASHSTQPRFQTAGSFVGFSFLILVALAFNLWVAFLYLVTNWNSSEPF